MIIMKNIFIILSLKNLEAKIKDKNKAEKKISPANCQAKFLMKNAKKKPKTIANKNIPIPSMYVPIWEWSPPHKESVSCALLS